MSKTDKIKKEQIQRYPKEPILKTFENSAIRWNVNSIIWYKRLIDGVLGALILSGVCMVISLVFVLTAPMPKLYASDTNGNLFLLPYTKNPNLPVFQEIRSRLTLEQKDLESMGGQKLKPVKR